MLHLLPCFMPDYTACMIAICGCSICDGCIQMQSWHASFTSCCSLSCTRPCCSSKILTQDKEHFARLAVDAVLRLKGSSNLESIHIIKKTGGTLKVCASCLAPTAMPSDLSCSFLVFNPAPGWLACSLASALIRVKSTGGVVPDKQLGVSLLMVAFLLLLPC